MVAAALQCCLFYHTVGEATTVSWNKTAKENILYCEVILCALCSFKKHFNIFLVLSTEILNFIIYSVLIIIQNISLAGSHLNFMIPTCSVKHG
jgi:hypothetical protein